MKDIIRCVTHKYPPFLLVRYIHLPIGVVAAGLDKRIGAGRERFIVCPEKVCIAAQIPFDLVQVGPFGSGHRHLGREKNAFGIAPEDELPAVHSRAGEIADDGLAVLVKAQN